MWEKKNTSFYEVEGLFTKVRNSFFRILLLKLREKLSL